MPDNQDHATLIEVHAHGMHLVASTFGGQVLRWRAGGRERLFPGSTGRHRPGSAVRGGVPVVFPQFAAWGNGPRHGFARTRAWRLVDAADGAVTMALEDDAATRATWPHAFRIEMRAELLAAGLSLGLAVHNPGPGPITFAAALHTYLQVSDVDQVLLHGLEARPYLEAPGRRTMTAPPGPLRLQGEVDRVYPDVESPLRLEDGDDTLSIAMDGFRDVVVWNPGEEKASALPDLAAGDHRCFVCVEAGAILAPVVLAPGGRWEGRQRLALSPA